MSRKIQITPTLVLVESPSKCKTIEKYLGPGYKCLASFGHIHHISSLKQIDVAHGFQLTYEVLPDKKKHLATIQQALRACGGDVLLACDNDREGEAIAYSLCLALHLDPATVRRILFNEITEQAVQHAVLHPQPLNMDLVRAQQCRQILDLAVGYKISPVLWDKLCFNRDNPLSAGRCQTPALRLVYENHLEIEASTWVQQFQVAGVFTNAHLTFHLSKPLATEEETRAFLAASVNHPHLLSKSEPESKTRSPPEPFCTATLLRAAGSQLGYGPKQTMRLCQTLYERGLITYMRTDSQKYSIQFLEEAHTYIAEQFGFQYLGAHDMVASNTTATTTTSPKKKKQTKKNQKKEEDAAAPAGVTFEAHEAIRPVTLHPPPANVFGTDEGPLKRLFFFVRTHAIASCMAAQQVQTMVISLTSPCPDAVYRYTAEKELFAGFQAQVRFAAAVEDTISESNALFDRLRLLQTSRPYAFHQLTAHTSLTGRKPHLTEARLVELLKDRGIGRPSTYASLIQKIQDRGYVKLADVPGKQVVCRSFVLRAGEALEVTEESKELGQERQKLVLQPLGRLAVEFLLQHFQSLFAYEFTSHMETQLDQVAHGQLELAVVCQQCWDQVEWLVQQQQEAAHAERVLDDEHTLLVGRFGPVIRKHTEGEEEATFLAVNPEVATRAFHTATLEELLQPAEDKQADQLLGMQDDHAVWLKQGRFGPYVEWNNQTRSVPKGVDVEAVTFSHAMEWLQDDPQKKIVRHFSDSVSIRHGPRGPYIFYKTPKMKKPKFIDLRGCPWSFPYDACSGEEFLEWLRVKHGVSSKKN